MAVWRVFIALAVVFAPVCLLLCALYALVVCVLPRRYSAKLHRALATAQEQGGPGELPELLTRYG